MKRFKTALYLSVHLDWRSNAARLALFPHEKMRSTLERFKTGCQENLCWACFRTIRKPFGQPAWVGVLGGKNEWCASQLRTPDHRDPAPHSSRRGRLRFLCRSCNRVAKNQRSRQHDVLGR